MTSESNAVTLTITSDQTTGQTEMQSNCPNPFMVKMLLTAMLQKVDEQIGQQTRIIGPRDFGQVPRLRG